MFDARKFNITGNSTLTIGLVYRKPNINDDYNTKIQNGNVS